MKSESQSTVTGQEEGRAHGIAPWIYLAIADTIVYLNCVYSLIVLHECSRTAIQDTLKPWCLGSYADLAYS